MKAFNHTLGILAIIACSTAGTMDLYQGRVGLSMFMFFLAALNGFFLNRKLNLLEEREGE